MTNNPYELYHHGIPGMKWGIQKGPPYPLSANKISKEARAQRKAEQESKYSEDYKKAHSGKSYREMSNQELRETTNRLQLESNYIRLDKELQGEGQSWIKKNGTKFLKEHGLEIAGGALTLVGAGSVAAAIPGGKAKQGAALASAIVKTGKEYISQYNDKVIAEIAKRAI